MGRVDNLSLSCVMMIFIPLACAASRSAVATSRNFTCGTALSINYTAKGWTTDFLILNEYFGAYNIGSERHIDPFSVALFEPMATAVENLRRNSFGESNIGE